MQTNKVIGGVIIVVVVGLGGWFYFDSNKVPTVNTTPNTQSDVSSPIETGMPTIDSSGTVETEVVKEFSIIGKNFSFTPSVMEVNKGDKVKITFKNEDGFHDLKIDEYNVVTPKLQAGKESVVEFTANKAGSFEYYCSVGSHRAMGMKGTLIVK